MADDEQDVAEAPRGGRMKGLLIGGLIAVFAGGYLLAWFVRRLWQPAEDD